VTGTSWANLHLCALIASPFFCTFLNGLSHEDGSEAHRLDALQLHHAAAAAAARRRAAQVLHRAIWETEDGEGQWVGQARSRRERGRGGGGLGCVGVFGARLRLLIRDALGPNC